MQRARRFAPALLVARRGRRPQRQRAAAAALARRLAGPLLARQGQARALRQRGGGRPLPDRREARALPAALSPTPACRCIVRITPFSQPRRAGRACSPRAAWRAIDDTRVMVARAICRRLQCASRCRRRRVAAAGRPRGVRRMRRRAARLAARAAAAPMPSAWRSRRCPIDGWVLRRDGRGRPCWPAGRSRSRATWSASTTSSPPRRRAARAGRARLCASCCDRAAARAHDRLSAGRCGQLAPRAPVYRRLGFADAYAYHYRTAAQQVG